MSHLNFLFCTTFLDCTPARFALTMTGLLLAIASAQGQGFVGVEMQNGVFPGPPQRPAMQVAAVLAGLPAEKAGVQAGDIIFRFSGRDIESPQQFAQEVRVRKPGDEVTLHILRGGTVIVFTLNLGVRPPFNAEKLVGRWVPTDGEPVIIEFTDKGTWVERVSFGGKSLTTEGTYKFEGDKLEAVLTLGGKEQKETITISKLTDNEIVGKDSKGNEHSFRKVSELPNADAPRVARQVPGFPRFRDPFDVFEPVDPFRIALLPGLPTRRRFRAFAQFDPIDSPRFPLREDIFERMDRMIQQQVWASSRKTEDLLGRDDFSLPRRGSVFPMFQTARLINSQMERFEQGFAGSRGNFSPLDVNPLTTLTQQRLTHRDNINQALGIHSTRLGVSRSRFDDPLARFRAQALPKHLWVNTPPLLGVQPVFRAPIAVPPPPVHNIPQAGIPAGNNWEFTGLAVLVLGSLAAVLVERMLNRK